MSELRARVSSDRTERRISIEVLDGPLLEIAGSGNHLVRKIEVDLITIRIINGETVLITVSGGMVKADGTISDLRRGTAEWRASAVATSPEWVRRIWREAPAGVTTWRFLMAEDG